MILTWIDRLESEARRPSSRLDLGVGGRLDLGVGGRRRSLAALTASPNHDDDDDGDGDDGKGHGKKDTANLEKGRVLVV